ncbi:hypothetical protein D9M73_159700 [compost metagenome]
MQHPALFQHAGQLLQLPVERTGLLAHPYQVAIQRIEPCRVTLQRIRQPQARGHILFQSFQQRRLRRIATTAAHHLERLQQRHAGLEQRRQLPAEPRRVCLFAPLWQAERQPAGRPQTRHRDALANQPGAHISRAAPGCLAADRRAIGVGAVPAVEK